MPKRDDATEPKPTHRRGKKGGKARGRGRTHATAASASIGSSTPRSHSPRPVPLDASWGERRTACAARHARTTHTATSQRIAHRW